MRPKQDNKPHPFDYENVIGGTLKLFLRHGQQL